MKSEGNSLSLPRRFQRLTLLKLLARGGMGEVFLAASGGIEGAERPQVVKIIRREHADDKSFLARFLDEARIQAQLQHPGVAQILEADTDAAGKPYVVVEHVEGRNLGEVRGRASQLSVRMSWPEVVAIAASLADALAHVHERTDAAGRPLDIVHRDLSPQNIVVGYNGDVKLIDFGTARGENRRCHTVAGVVFAKPGYVAPEVANNTPGGVPADLYAFGVIVWELLAGRRFLFGDPAAHLAAVAAGQRSPSSLTKHTGCPPELDAVIGRLTAVEIADRYATAREAHADLVGLLKQAPSAKEGDRSVRGRVAGLMRNLYPAEPARSRAEFAHLVESARQLDLAPEAETSVDAPPVSPTADPALLPGTRYRIERELGAGATGIVYEAHHIDLGRTVALKVLTQSELPREAEARFRAEARAIARLVHDNIVKVHDFGVAADGRLFYAMELLAGESLDRTLEREGPVPWRRAAVLGRQACAALEAAHAAGIVHGDLKPGNLLLLPDGTLKLLDFGMARTEAVVLGRDSKRHDDEARATSLLREAERERASCAAESAHLPSPSPGAISIAGTPDYMAPEQITGALPTPVSDVYSLASVLYELVTGRPPICAATTVALMDAKLRKDPDTARTRAPQRGISKMLDRTLSRALSRHPELRFQSAAELRAALDEALREPEVRQARRRRLALSALASMLVLSAIGAGVVMTQPELKQTAWKRVQPTVERLEALRQHVLAMKDAAAPAAVAIAPAATKAVSAGGVSESPSEPVVVAAPVISMDEGQPEAELTENSSAFAAVDDTGASEDSREAQLADADAEKVALLEAELDAVRSLLDEERTVKALHALRKLGKLEHASPEVFELWSKTAAQTRAWGEALRVAKRWADMASDEASRLHLAHMQRIGGKESQMIATLEQLLSEQPDCAEAKAMLDEATSRRVALRR